MKLALLYCELLVPAGLTPSLKLPKGETLLSKKGIPLLRKGFSPLNPLPKIFNNSLRSYFFRK